MGVAKRKMPLRPRQPEHTTMMSMIKSLDRQLKRLEDTIGTGDGPRVQIVSAEDLPGTSIVLVNCTQRIGSRPRRAGIVVVIGGAEPDGV